MDLHNPSVLNLWNRFTRQHRQYKNSSIPNHFYFCDNEHDANTCAELVVQNIKQATATSMWWYKYHNELIPKVGTLFIVTDWHCDARAIIEVIKLEQIRFKDVGEAIANT